MNFIKVASGVVNQTPLDWENNLRNIINAINEAKKQDVSILCLPELCISGYGCEDAFYSQNTYEQCISALRDVVSESKGIAVCVGLPVWHANKLFNSSCFIVDGRILGFVCKQHLPNYGIFYEDRWFNRWPKGVKDQIFVDKIAYPIGDLSFDLNGIKIGFEICEDAWVSDRPANRLFDNGIDIILNPSASPFEFGKFETRERLILESSRTFGVTYVYTNLLGNEAGRLIFDGDALIASNGNLMVSGPRFSYEDFFICSAISDIDENKNEQVVIKSRAQVNPNLISWPFNFPENLEPRECKAELEAFEKGGYVKEEEFARAVGLALFDYLRKSKSNGYTISLSGGADSSACVALCALMIYLGEESIGIEKFLKKLGHISKIQGLTKQKEIASHLIHTLYQATKNSSDETFNSAKSLAESMGAKFMNIDIDSIVNDYSKLIEGQIGRKLSWVQDDIAMQNIQARVRAPSIWMFTNISNHLLIATSNRSEVAVGYATMDGDTAGSISPLADIDKTWLRHWLVWLEKIGCNVKSKHIKVEGLKYVNNLQPTAELRPKENKQTDEKDLMPYEFLNEVEKLAILKRKSPLECYKTLLPKFEEVYPKESILLWTKRFFTLWSRNQWKRERYALGFHLDSYDLDSRSWMRYPVLNGGFKQEIFELDSYANLRKPNSKNRIGF